MFGDFQTISYVKIWNHPTETTLEQWLFRVPVRNCTFVAESMNFLDILLMAQKSQRTTCDVSAGLADLWTINSSANLFVGDLFPSP